MVRTFRAIATFISLSSVKSTVLGSSTWMDQRMKGRRKGVAKLFPSGSSTRVENLTSALYLLAFDIFAIGWKTFGSL